MAFALRVATMLRTLLASALCVATLPSQDPALRIADALLRDDIATARAVVETIGSPAVRARTAAALLPARARAVAMLEVAQGFRGEPEVDAAIRAGAAALLATLAPELAPRELAEFEARAADIDDDDLHATMRLADVSVGLRDELAARLATTGCDRPALLEAAHWLSLASVSVFEATPARIHTDEPWDVPTPRGEDLVFRAFRAPPGPLERAATVFDSAPSFTYVLPAGATDRSLPSLPPGTWTIELASVSTPWRAVRPVEVSDLDVVGLVEREQIALLTRTRDGSDGTRITLRSPQGTPRSTTCDDVCVMPRGTDGDRATELVASTTTNSVAWLPLPAVDHDRFAPPPLKAHLMVDRPLYRAGDAIETRIVVQSNTWRGEGLDAVVRSSPARGVRLELRAFAGSDDERRIELTTDRHGVATATVPIAPERGPGDVRLQLRAADGDTVLVDATPCVVSAFVRPTLSVVVEGPKTFLPTRNGHITLTARVVWASGGPATGVPVHVAVRVGTGSTDEVTRELNTDADGRVIVPIELDPVGTRPIRARFTVADSAGAPRVVDHLVLARTTPEPTPPPADDGAALALRVDAPPVLDQLCTVVVRGAPHADVLVVTGRGSRATAESVRLDPHGRGVVVVTPNRDAWPFLDITATTGDHTATLREPVRRRDADAPTITLPTEVRPGADVAATVDVGVADARVTIAVVDERIFTLQPDRLADPATALRPVPMRPRWYAIATATPITPLRVLAEMLVNGRVPPPPDASRFGLPAAGGASAGPSAPGSATRSDFRATAAFVHAITDADGRATLRFRMPADLTTFRATIVGVEPDGEAFVERRRLTTSLPLGAEPLLPRMLRVGDRVDVPVVVDRHADAAAPTDTVQVTCAVTGDAFDVGVATTTVVAAAGRTGVVTLPIRARSEGEATLAIAASLGALDDRSERPLTVAADAVRFPRIATATGAGRIEVAAHEDTSPDRPVDVVVLAPGQAVRLELERRLARYPYGCVEQTMSGLLPFFAELHRTRTHGLPEPIVDPEFVRRLDHGLRRLRALQAGRGGGFAWWPDGAVDARMTALVVNGLCVMRDAGFDPGAHRLTCDPEREPFRDALGKVAAGATDVAAVELVAAVLRWDPALTAAHDALARATDADATWSAGAWARVGLALVAAGDRGRAQRCLARSTVADDVPHGFPGDAPLVAAAARLELTCRLDPDAARHGADPATLALRTLTEPASTLATSSALVALALAMPPDDATPLDVTIRSAHDEQAVRIDTTSGMRARVHLASPGPFVVEGPADTPLIVQIHGERIEPGSAHAAWARPIEVTRTLLRRNGDALEPIGTAPIRRGERLTLRITARAPDTVRYAVVECPLPPGVEPTERLRWCERSDDRLAFTLPAVTERELTREIELVANLTGHFAWPPTTVTSMYDAGCDGGTAGATLDVVLPDESNGAIAESCRFEIRTTWAAPPRPSAAEQLEARLSQHADQVLDVWFLDVEDGIHGLDDATARDRAQARTSLDRLDRDGATDPVVRLQVAMRLADALPRLEDGLARTFRNGAWCRGAELAPWRLELLATLRGRVARDVDVLVQRIERHDPTLDLDRVTRALTDAMWSVDHDETRERLAARVVAATVQWAPDLAEDSLDTALSASEPARTPELRSAIRFALGSRDSSLRDFAMEAMTTADRVQLDPTLLLRAQGPWWSNGVVRALTSTAAGRRVMHIAVQDPELVARQAEQIVDELPESLWPSLPLRALEQLAGELPRTVLVDRVARSTATDATLQAAFAHAEPDADWRGVLCGALARRGVRHLEVADWRDPATWCAERALDALATGDATALVRWLDATDPDRAGDLATAALRPIVLHALAGVADATQFARFFAEFEADDDQRAVDRLAAQDLPGLLDAAQYLPVMPSSIAPDDFAVLWRHALAIEDLRRVAELLCATPAGTEFVRARFDELDPASAATVREVFAASFGIDPATGTPLTSPVEVVLDRLARHGLASAWTTDERALLDRALALRGL